MADQVWPVDWFCQDCGTLQKTTYDVPPGDGLGDPDCCWIGSMMSQVPKCHICGHNLDFGDNLCEHQPTKGD